MPATSHHQPKKLTPEQEQECARAEQTIRDIDTLAKNPEFRRFMERLDRETKKMADQVLEGDFETPVEREEMRLKRLGIVEALRIPKQDRQGSVSTLKTHGRPVPVFQPE